MPCRESQSSRGKAVVHRWLYEEVDLEVEGIPEVDQVEEFDDIPEQQGHGKGADPEEGGNSEKNLHLWCLGDCL